MDPKDYHKKLGEENTVVIDVRNAYESDIGRFGGQTTEGGAELLVPDMRKSTDFPDWIEREETKEKLQGTSGFLLVLLLETLTNFEIARHQNFDAFLVWNVYFPLLHFYSLLQARMC